MLYNFKVQINATQQTCNDSYYVDYVKSGGNSSEIWKITECVEGVVNC